MSRILVVDDDPSIVSVVGEILTAEGHEVFTATDGAEALAKLKGAELVLLDMRMPGVDGWEFAKRFRAAGERARILVMTANQDARRWAEEIGADGYVEKPFDLDTLVAAVERCTR